MVLFHRVPWEFVLARFRDERTLMRSRRTYLKLHSLEHEAKTLVAPFVS